MIDRNAMHILLVPDTREGAGIGHLKRVCRLAVAVRAENGHATICADSPSDSQLQYIRTYAAGIPLVSDHSLEAGNWDLVLVDMRTSDIDTVARFREIAPVIGLDAGGEGRRLMSYLVDSLPRAIVVRNAERASGDAPNVRGQQFLILDEAATPMPSRSGILVTFGGEDPAMLTEKVVQLLLRQQELGGLAITVVRGPLFSTGRPAIDVIPKGIAGGRVTVVDGGDSIRELIASHALVITSFGLTAFEARRAEVPVLLVNVSSYHLKLARAAGFASAGVRATDPARFSRALRQWRDTGALLAEPATDPLFGSATGPAAAGTPALLGLLRELDTSAKSGCPVCSRLGNPAVARYGHKSYFRCTGCGMLYMENFARGKIEYTREYFFNDYEKQYGKTYLEDFDHIRSLAAPRLDWISRFSSGNSLLDVGCAFGPFLSQAREAGFHPCGVDISQDAVDYVRETLGFRAVASSILDFESQSAFGLDRFDVVTLWYVIEHFAEVRRLLERLSLLVRPGGVLAFSTPSGSGVSARTAAGRFFERSPDDHYTIWEPRRTAAILQRFGFTVRHIRVTGHHPERFFQRRTDTLESASEPADNRSIGRLRQAVANLASRAFGLGDTFEVYATRDQE
ncbi:MAG TPA: methyltransferase domain-containing protein [Spirochaetia bacterium]|nr:methyltransferase domain-containing protein [Spirochaetia bacterium]